MTMKQPGADNGLFNTLLSAIEILEMIDWLSGY